MKISLIDKDARFRGVLKHLILENTNFDVSFIGSVESFLLDDQTDIDLVIINCTSIREIADLKLGAIRDSSPAARLLLISSPDNADKLVGMLEYEVYDIITYGDNFKEKFLNIIRNLIEVMQLEMEVDQLKTHLSRKYEVSSSMVGESKAIKKVLALVEKAASVPNVTVSIHGESGTGKELAARTIHFNSLREKHPFITVNLGALPNEMVESELFGHEPGSSPAAYSRFTGKIEQANNGTIFINDIADLDINLQFSLLQAIQDKRIKRAGSSKEIIVDTRVITATSRDLSVEVKNGRFREDLYFRLLGLPIVMPSLSERQNDVILLAKHFLNSFCQENNLPEKRFSPAARNKLLDHSYPGNVRELNAIVELAALLSGEEIIDEEQILFSPTNAGLDIFSTEIPLREYEIKIIRHFLEKYNNNVVLVARKLQIGKSKIYNMIKNGEL